MLSELEQLLDQLLVERSVSVLEVKGRQLFEIKGQQQVLPDVLFLP